MKGIGNSWIAAFLWVGALLVAGLVPAQSEPLTAPTSTGPLRLPDRIPGDGYRLVNAFPELTFRDPVALATPPGETNRLFVVERTGIIYVLTNLARPSKTVFLDLAQSVNASYLEAGLLGLAFHPGFRTNRSFFVFQTKQTSTPGAAHRLHDVVSRFEASPVDPNAAMASSELTILAQLDDSDVHNGGDLKFGPDGYLYISVGERENRDINWPDQTPVNRDLQGAILRIDVDGRPGNLPPNPHPASTDRYWIPADNPFVGVNQHHGLAVSPSEVRTELFATGLRNPWRMAFDPISGDLYVADVGQDRQEEVDLVLPGGDYGWPYFEGFLPMGYPLPPVFAPQPPLHIYPHGNSGGTNEGCIIGGVVYRGAAIPWLEGCYLFADLNSGHCWSLRRQGADVTVERLLATVPGLSAFGTDPRDHEVLVTHLYSGAILRLVYVEPNVATNAPSNLAETGIFADLLTLTPNAGVLPYEINVPFWSDDAIKTRWFSVPATNRTITFNPTGTWAFPTGAIWVKHFELQLTNGLPNSARRLETRVLVKARDGYYGLTYRWGDSRTDAWLVPEGGQRELFTIRDTNGNVVRQQEWLYPARADCLNCHTKLAGHVLGFNTAQLNRAVKVGDGATNQLLALAAAGYLTPSPSASTDLPALAAADDTSAPQEFRVRSFLQANCSQCHVPGGDTLASWDARLTTPLSQAGIVSPTAELARSGLGVVRPGDLHESKLYHRLLGSLRQMPPIGTTVLNTNAVNLVANWITNLPLAPWSYESIGDVIHFGGSTHSNGVYRVGGTGDSLQGTNDSFQFMHRPFDHPAAHLITRLDSQSSRSNLAVAGLMAREGTGAADRFVLAACRPDKLTFGLQRSAPGAPTLLAAAAPVSLPQWLRLARLGSEITAFQSDDGTNWFRLGASSWEISGPVVAGFAVNSASRTAFNNATFSDVSYLSVGLTSSAPTTVRQPANVTLQANVEQSGRALTRVVFLDGAEKIGETGANPLAITLSNLWSGNHEFRAQAIDEAGTVVVSQPIRLAVQPHPSLAGPLDEETGPGGMWPGGRGAKGYAIANNETNLPAFVDVALTGAEARTWDPNTQDERALAKVGTDHRIAAAWTASNALTLSVTLRDGGLCQLSLYCVDWETANRRIQRFEFIEPTTGRVLRSYLLSNFSRGVYLTLTIRGSLNIRLSALAGPGPVLSGLFLDQGSNAPPTVELIRPSDGQFLQLPSDLTAEAIAADSEGPIRRVEFYLDGNLASATEQYPFKVVLANLREGTHLLSARAYDELGDFGDSLPVSVRASLPHNKAVFLGEDTTTRGSWLQRYGTEGFLLPLVTNWWPTAFPFAARDPSPWRQPSGLDFDYLEQPNESLRAFSFLYSTSPIDCDLNLSDGHPRKVALYFYDDAAYPQLVTILDAATGQSLDERAVTNGYGGRYLGWNLQGHLVLRITNPIRGAQARVNGLFLDPFPYLSPTISLEQPAADQDVMTPAKLLLRATAAVPDGVRRVEFHTDTAKLGQVTEPPYQLLWEYPVAGRHQVFARAVSATGAAGDSKEVTVSVHSSTPPAVRFVNSDAVTGGNWKGVYGTDGYWLPSNLNYSNLPTSVAITNRQAWTDYGDWQLPRQLSRPNGLTRLLSFWIGSTWQFQVRWTDGRAHRLTLYNYAPGWTNAIRVTIRAGETGTRLDTREIPSQDTGTYLTWDLQGDLIIEVAADPTSSGFLNGIFIDPTPNPYDDWQRRYFTLAEQAIPMMSGETADPDSDGYVNWTESLLGRNPTAPDLQAPLWLEREDGELFLHVLVARLAGDGDVTLESSPDLRSWTAASNPKPVEVLDRAEQIELRYQVLPNYGQPSFFRLRLQPPWPTGH